MQRICLPTLLVLVFAATMACRPSLSPDQRELIGNWKRTWTEGGQQKTDLLSFVGSGRMKRLLGNLIEDNGRPTALIGRWQIKGSSISINITSSSRPDVMAQGKVDQYRLDSVSPTELVITDLETGVRYQYERMVGWDG